MLNHSSNVIEISTRDESRKPGPLISVVVPTYNEKSNVPRVVDELSQVLKGVEWEVIFVDDDSPDLTADLVRQFAVSDARVRCIQRLGRRGLSTACIEGMLASSAPYLAVMDGDLQHDPRLVREMFERLHKGDTDLVIGSRYMEGGGCGEWSPRRQRISRFATQLGNLVLVDKIKDPMSNFFAIRRELFEEVVRGLSQLSFKILLDILLTARRRLRFQEIPYVLGVRDSGESKFEVVVAWEYLMLLADKTIGRYIPARFLSFAVVGATAAGAHFLALETTYRAIGLGFVASELSATLVSIACNYALNNVLTYSDVRKRGFRWVTGLLSFAVVCSGGVAANIGLAAYLFNRGAGWILSAVAGVLAGSVWNYAATSFYTWGRRK